MMKKSRRQGAVIQRLGHYNPDYNARLLFINVSQLAKWVNRGAIVHSSVKRRLIKFIGLYKYSYDR